MLKRENIRVSVERQEGSYEDDSRTLSDKEEEHGSLSKGVPGCQTGSLRNHLRPEETVFRPHGSGASEWIFAQT